MLNRFTFCKPHFLRSQFSTKSQEQIIHDVPSVNQIPLLRNLIPVDLMLFGGAEKLHEFIDYRHKCLGPVFREQLGPTTSIFLSNPNDIRKVFNNEGKYPKHVLPESWLLYNKIKNYNRGLYFMDGEEWFECRRILNRVLLKDFQFDKLEVDDFLTTYFERWKLNLNDGEIVDLEKHLYNVSIIFMVLYLMGDSFTAHSKLFLPLVDRLASVVGEIFHWSVRLSLIPANLAKLCGFNSWKNFVLSVDESIKISSDLLDLILRFGGGNGIVRDMIDNGIPEKSIRAIVVDFILAAGDTTATATQWTLYLLGKYKSIQEQIYVELKNKNTNEYGNLPLLKNCIRESMRLYPVAPFITRYLPNDICLGSHVIKAGELISMSMYTCSRSEVYFPEASQFNPDRWIRSSENGHYKLVSDAYASLPYSQGSRSCIGKKLSQNQLVMTVGKIISMYELRTMNEVYIKLNLIPVPSIPIRLHLKRRN